MKTFIVLAEGFEEVEAITPMDLLRRAEIEVSVVGLNGKEVTGAHNIKMIADNTLDEIDPSGYDACIFPGGLPGAEHLGASEKVKKIIQDFYARGKLVAAICASPALVLFPAGVLDGKKATCYPGFQDKFSGDVSYVEESAVVDGNIITSRGPGTAIDFSLAIIEYLKGKETRDKIAAGILKRR